MSRVKIIAQKRASLKRQLTSLENLFTIENPDEGVLKLRIDRVREQFLAYEELHDELAILEPENDALSEIDDIQTRYYTLAAKVNALTQAAAPPPTNLNTTSIVVDKTRRLKLPIAELPKFNGDLGNWLSFKHTFTTMVDSCDDITDLQKFIYLRDSLQAAALDKISIYNVSADNYKNAWELLLESYDKKRILIANHLDAIIELPVVSKPSHKGLTKLVDDMRQHVNMLSSLGVTPDEHLLIRILERALPGKTRAKWEETLDLEKSPVLSDLYKFISETAFRLFTTEQNTSHSKPDNGTSGNGVKRRQDQDQRPAKSQRGEQGARVFMTNASPDCLLCKGEQHRLYRCPAFLKLSVQGRWDFVKQSRLCRNCMRSHIGEKCKSSKHCKLCSKYHNTLLHDSPNKPGSGQAAASGSSSNTDERNSKPS